MPQTQEPAPASQSRRRFNWKHPSRRRSTPKPVAAADIIADIEFRGARRVPQDTLRALIISRKGDQYSEELLHRDFMALWNTGRFDDIRLEREAGPNTAGSSASCSPSGAWSARSSTKARSPSRSRRSSTGSRSARSASRSSRSTIRTRSSAPPIVLKEFLSERGRQFATVEPKSGRFRLLRSKSSFKVNEGPKVKVGEIDDRGQQVFSDDAVLRAMKNLAPDRHSALDHLREPLRQDLRLEQAREDKDMIRNFYQERGYFTARVVESQRRPCAMSAARASRFRSSSRTSPASAPISRSRSKRASSFQLNNINFVGVKLFRTPDSLMRPLFQMEEGDVFSTAKLRKGMENLRKLYGEFGYIDFVPEPDSAAAPGTDKIDLTFNVDEGKQFFVRRIDFSGQHHHARQGHPPRMLIDEGDIFNTRLWEVSILRLNQLGYFEQLKEERGRRPSSAIRRPTPSTSRSR